MRLRIENRDPIISYGFVDWFFGISKGRSTNSLTRIEKKCRLCYVVWIRGLFHRQFKGRSTIHTKSHED